MKNEKNYNYIYIICLSACLFQVSFSDTLSLIDSIEIQVENLKNSNLQLKQDNEKVNNLLQNSEIQLQNLNTIIWKQNELLNLWENNWMETQQVLQQLENSLDNSEKKLNIYRTTIPIAIVVSVTLITTVVVCK